MDSVASPPVMVCYITAKICKRTRGYPITETGFLDGFGKPREEGWHMVQRFNLFGLIEYRRYGFGGVYLIVGQKWFTLKRGSMP